MSPTVPPPDVPYPPAPRCATGCLANHVTPRGWLDHWKQCPHVATWIRTWAQRLAERDDWRRRVGLDR